MAQEQASDESSVMEVDESPERPLRYPLQRLELNQNQMLSPNDTDDGTIDNDRVEYAVLLPDSFAVIDSTFDQHSL